MFLRHHEFWYVIAIENNIMIVVMFFVFKNKFGPSLDGLFCVFNQSITASNDTATIIDR